MSSINFFILTYYNIFHSLHGFTDDSGHECLKNVKIQNLCVRERERVEKMTISKSEKLVLYSMILLGLGYLAPYNSVLTAVDYFTDKFGSDIEYYVAAALVRIYFFL